MFYKCSDYPPFPVSLQCLPSTCTLSTQCPLPLNKVVYDMSSQLSCPSHLPVPLITLICVDLPLALDIVQCSYYSNVQSLCPPRWLPSASEPDPSHSLRRYSSRSQSHILSCIVVSGGISKWLLQMSFQVLSLSCFLAVYVESAHFCSHLVIYSLSVPHGSYQFYNCSCCINLVSLMLYNLL